MKTQRARTVFAFLAGAVALSLTAGCGDTPTDADEGMVGNGSWYSSGYHWPHDGNPLETPHFVIYSDAASLEARRKLGDIAEELITKVMEDLEVDPATMFKWPSGQTKLHIYTYRDHYEQSWGGKGYYGGLIIWSLDHPIRNTEIDNYRRVVTHELTHTIQNLLAGTVNPKLVDIWVTEGIAEHLSGGTSTPGNITSLAMLDSLAAVHGGLNPISMHAYEDFPYLDMGTLYLYPMFELSVRYLLDPEGLGLPASSIRDMIIDGGEGAAFPASFEEKLGIGLQQFEDEYWVRIRAYLSR